MTKHTIPLHRNFDMTKYSLFMKLLYGIKEQKDSYHEFVMKFKSDIVTEEDMVELRHLYVKVLSYG